MTRATLLALASRVEAATSGCRKLDAEICSRLFGRSIGVSRYTFNIDAALSLVPSGWNHGYSSRQGTEPSWRVVAQCWNAKPASTLHGEAATPALALTAACLRARAIAWSMTDD